MGMSACREKAIIISAIFNRRSFIPRVTLYAFCASESIIFCVASSTTNVGSCNDKLDIFYGMDKKLCTFFLLLIYILKCVSSYKNQDKGHTEIPHDNIANTETSIDLQYNLITNLGPMEFDGYTRLKTIYLKYNRIDYIDPTAFRTTQLEVFLAGYNALTEFPDFSVVSETLVKLGLASNRITRINRDLLNLPNLEKLHLQNNLLTYVPSELFRASKSYLALSGNQLQMSELLWNQNLCDGSSLTILKLDNIYKSLAELPPLKIVLCQRSSHLQLHLSQVNHP